MNVTMLVRPTVVKDGRSWKTMDEAKVLWDLNTNTIYTTLATFGIENPHLPIWLSSADSTWAYTWQECEHDGQGNVTSYIYLTQSNLVPKRLVLAS